MEKLESVDWTAFITVLGASGLFHVETIASRLKPGGLLLIVDSDPDAVRTILSFRSLPKLGTKDTQIRFCISRDIQTIAREFRQLLAQRDSYRFTFYIHPG